MTGDGRRVAVTDEGAGKSSREEGGRLRCGASGEGEGWREESDNGMKAGRCWKWWQTAMAAGRSGQQR